MTAAVALAGYALLAGVVAPAVLSRARWPHRAPAVGVLAWQGLMVTFVVSTALAVYHLVVREHHVHDGFLGLLSACGLAPDAPTAPTATTATTALTGDSSPFGAAAALLAPAAIVLLPSAWLVRTVARTRRARRRHLDLLTLVGRPAPEYGATVVEHGVPAVYCLPGRSCRVVVTRGALDVLSEEQLRAVLEHERGHLVGRHHLLHMETEAFALAFPGLPLARHAKEQTALLLEMAADDRALRSHPREVLAAAMCEVAGGQAPRAALGAAGAGGAGALIRLRRVLAPQPEPHRVTWLGIVAASVLAPLLPLFLACGPAV
ncbi:M56 family metallopeptidase [Streptomyces sp. NBC_01433]|uniref:M56 family metallopeptidase n=1 Tax=Streptomyces sp. NBC_01433 TaxID=2903864 RepID=UPI00225AFCC5|nr:M56 family metallopeptidase [Streptomyces sp. NBC_01433]MCX4680747.1 M56 family metallopeptidase [Streptomyces sp. NBC_01433]